MQVGVAALALAWLLHGALPDGPSVATGADEEAQWVLEGRVVRAGDRRPAEAVSVLVTPEPTRRRPGIVEPDEFMGTHGRPAAWVVEETTNDDGRFTIAWSGSARVRLVVLGPGFERYEAVVDRQQPTRRGMVIFLRADGDAYRTVVRDRTPALPHRVAARDLSKTEIRALPGTQGDPLRAIQNFPGVARAPAGLGLLILRGASPSQSRVFYGEHPIPRAFHALALSSIVPEGAIESLEFIPGNAPARYGEVTGGVVALEPRRPRRDGIHGFGKLDLTSVGALTEGRAGKGAFLVGAQRGHVDLLLEAIGKIPPQRTYSLPRYYDYQALFTYPIGRRTQLDVRALGAGDRILARAPEARDPSQGDFSSVQRVQYELAAQFHRADVAVVHRHGPWSLRASPSFRFERNVADARFGDTLERNDAYVNWRIEAERQLSRRASITIGTDGEVDPYRVETTQRNSMLNPFDDPVVVDESSQRGLLVTAATYALADVRLGPVSLWPGVRASAYVLGDDAEFSVDPKGVVGWEINERWTWRLGVGQYSQAQVPQRTETGGLLDSELAKVSGNVVLPASARALEPSAGFLPVTQDVQVARALQASSAVTYAPRPAWVLELGAYLRRRDNADGAGTVEANEQVVPSLAPETTNLDYGLEALVRRRLSRRLFGWIAYTLSRSQTRSGAVGSTPGRVVPGPFDQRHILAVLASYALPRNWRVGGRFRLVSGSPYTPRVGVVFDPDAIVDDPNDAVTGGPPIARPVFGGTNAARFPVFHQLDLRVDKQWILSRMILTAYLDVQNVYNRENVEAYLYDHLYLEQTNSLGLPILPSLGLRVDW